MSGIKTEVFNITTPEGDIYLKKWIPDNIESSAPIILIHDSLGSVGLWKDFPQVLSLLLSRCVVGYDRLGFGQSGDRVKLPSVDFIKEEAEIYFPLIKQQLSIKDFILLGHSVGGGMAINIAARDSDCSGVITLAAQAFVEEITISGIKEAKVFFEQETQIKRLEKWHGLKAEWVLSAWIDVWLSPSFANWSLSDCIKNVLCPTLVIHGDKDEYGSIAFPNFIIDNVSGLSEMQILKDCGHVPHKEQTPAVINLISKFLNRNKL